MSGFNSGRSGRVSQTIHQWAQQNKAHGQSSNVRFDGQRLFSYQAEIGRFYPNETKAGQRIVVLSQKNYSPTTSTHQGWARSATSQYFRIEFDDWTSELPIDWQRAKKIILKKQLADLKARCESLTTKRNVESALAQISVNADNINDLYRNCFRQSEFPKKSPFTPAALRILALVGGFTQDQRNTYLARHFDPGLAQRIEKEKQRDQNRAQNKLIRAENKRLKNAERLELWKQGNNFHPGIFFDNAPIALRVRDESIETSRGARVPVNAALLLYDRLVTEPATVVGFKIGDFTVRDFIGTNGDRILRVGCHDIPFKEIERIREQLP